MTHTVNPPELVETRVKAGFSEEDAARPQITKSGEILTRMGGKGQGIWTRQRRHTLERWARDVRIVGFETWADSHEAEARRIVSVLEFPAGEAGAEPTGATGSLG